MGINKCMQMYFYIVIAVVVIMYIFIPIGLFLAIKNAQVLKLTYLIYVSFFVCMIILLTILDIKIKMPYITAKLNFNINFYYSKSVIYDLSGLAKYDLFTNMVLLAPIGGLMYLIDYRKYLFVPYCFFVGVYIGTFIEVMQLLLPISRVVQLIDVLLNGVSVMLGGIFFYVISSSIGLHDKLYLDV